MQDFRKIRLIELILTLILIGLTYAMAFYPEWMINYVIIMDI